MSIFMVSRVEDKIGNIIGVGLLDTSTVQFKVVNSDELIYALSDKKIKVENLDVVHGKLTGINGSIERYPKVDARGNILNNPSVTILSELTDGENTIGYKISDFKGSIINVERERFVGISKISGIANGKIVSRLDRELISAIKGDYIKENIKYKNKEMKNEQYIGEEISYIPKLKPILTSAQLYTGSIPHYTVIAFDNGELKEYDEYEDLNESHISMSEIYKDYMYCTDTHTLCGFFHRSLIITDKNIRNKLLNYIRVKSVRDSIDREIIEMSNKVDGTKHKVHKETGIVIPKRYEIYTPIIINESLTQDKHVYEDVPIDVIKKYMIYLRVMNVGVYNRIDLGHKKIALARECTQQGINYKVLELNKDRLYSDRSGNGYHNIVEKPLEDIYANNSEYSNVNINMGNMIVIGLDGAYSYNMDRVLDEYNREVSKTTRDIKARALGYEYKEVIHKNGDLRYIRTSSRDVIIPNEARNILDGAITILGENDRIIFGNNLERCGEECIRKEWFVSNNVLMVEIGCNEIAGLNIIRSIIKYRDSLYGRKIALKYNRDITPREYGNAIFCFFKSYNRGLEEIKIISDNIKADGDNLILNAIKFAIEDQFDNFRILDNPIEVKWRKRRLTKFRQAYEIVTENNKDFELLVNKWIVFNEACNVILKENGSVELKQRINIMFRKISDKMRERGSEFQGRRREIENSDF